MWRRLKKNVANDSRSGLSIDASRIAFARWQIRDLLDYSVDHTVVELLEMPAQSTADRKSMADAMATRRSSIQEPVELLHGAVS